MLRSTRVQAIIVLHSPAFLPLELLEVQHPEENNPTPMTSASGVGNWTATVVLVDGDLNFVGDTTAASWGGTDFPAGTATLGGPAIAIPAGRYLINFNSVTLAYSFEAVEYYNVVGIIGSATAGGWDTDTDMELNPLGDSTDWKLRTSTFRW
jgi:hypothetical protein